MANAFAGRCAIVTGGASGIGAACSELLADAGAAVVIADRDGDLGERLAEQLSSRGRRAMHATIDVTRAEECHTLVGDAVGWAGSLDIAVNAAGIAGPTLRSSRCPTTIGVRSSPSTWTGSSSA
jgi:NAD(P)-dependent dehydrogenase (short-subunit alcohol dehydrogenase family)